MDGNEQGMRTAGPEQCGRSDLAMSEAWMKVLSKVGVGGASRLPHRVASSRLVCMSFSICAWLK